MPDNTIEIFGQKLSYPTTWHGASAVLVVCIAITVIAVIAKGWATPEVIRGLNGLNETSKEQESINVSLVNNIEALSAKLENLEARFGNAAEEGEEIAAGAPASTPDMGTGRDRQSLEHQLELSKLKGQLANQSLIRLKQVAPVVQPDQALQQQVQQFEQIQQTQQFQQQQIQQQIQQEWQ